MSRVEDQARKQEQEHVRDVQMIQMKFLKKPRFAMKVIVLVSTIVAIFNVLVILLKKRLTQNRRLKILKHSLPLKGMVGV